MAQNNAQRTSEGIQRARLDSLYMNALTAIDGAVKTPTDMGVFIANGKIDDFLGEYNKLGSNPPDEWRMKLQRLSPYLPQQGVPDYSGYTWKNYKDPNASAQELPPSTLNPEP